MGGLWAVDDQAAWRGQHPEEAQGSYEPVPAMGEESKQNLQLNKHKPKAFACYMLI